MTEADKLREAMIALIAQNAELKAEADTLRAEVARMREALEGLNGPDWAAMWYVEADQ
jgi:hypothetical protein